MRLTIFLFSLLLSTEIYSQKVEKLQDLSLIQDCNIISMNGDLIRSVPGKMCLFFDDGKFVSADERGIKLYDGHKSILWRMSGHFHHQLALSNDRKKILAFDSGFTEINGKKQRTDRVLIISLDGKILHEQSSLELLKMQKLPFLDWKNSPWLRDETKMEREISHFNSIYEIPDNANNRPGSPFQKGNFIINGLTQGLFIVTPDLKKIVYHAILKTSEKHMVHDVQATKRGNIIYFNNLTAEPTGKNSFSTIHEYDLINDKIVFEFKASPEQMFFNRYCGAIQEIDDDNILFSDKFNGTYIFSRKEKKMISVIRGTHYRDFFPVYNQSTKAQNLSKFLKNFK